MKTTYACGCTNDIYMVMTNVSDNNTATVKFFSNVMGVCQTHKEQLMTELKQLMATQLGKMITSSGSISSPSPAPPTSDNTTVKK